MFYTQRHINSRCAGVSLIELITSVTIIAMVTGLAISGFASLVARDQVSTQTNAILEALYLARSLAITTHKNIQVCALDPVVDSSCSNDRNYNSDWSNGWLVFSDNNNNNRYDTGDDLLRVTAMPGSVNIVFNQRGRLRFFPDGSARSAGFYVCDQQQQRYRHLYLLHSGRARINMNMSSRQKRICDENRNTL